MANEISVWICGPFGKMGTEVRNAIANADDITLTGVVSPEHVGTTCEANGVNLEVFSSLEDLAQSTLKPDVIVDFTFAEVAYQNALYAAANKIDFVSGTTGLTQDQKNEIIYAFENSEANAIIASNFSVGAVLMMHFAQEASKHFSNAEIVEVHHTQKKDMPSGTALTTRNMMAENSQLNEDNIPIHSLRLTGAIAHQQVHFSSQGEVLRIEHDANDRTCFMPGIILAIRKVHRIQTVLFSIESLLFDGENNG